MELRPSSSMGTQLHSLKDEYDSLQEVKDVELDRLEQELREANEEIHSLRLDAEEAAALHENEIAGLQEELCRLKAELERVQHIRNEYDLEITSLRAEINMKEPGTGDSQPQPEVTVVTHYDDRMASSSDNVTGLQEELQRLQSQYQELREEYQILQESNRIMVHQLERLEAIKYRRSRSNLDNSPSFDSETEENSDHRYFKRSSLQGGGSVSFKSVETVGFGGEYNDEDDRMSRLEEESSSELQLQLETQEQEVEKAQAQCNKAQVKLCEMKSKYQISCNEWEQLQEELHLCKEEIERLNGTIPVGGRVPAGGLKPIALFVVLAGGLLLYPCLKRLSCTSIPT